MTNNFKRRMNLKCSGCGSEVFRTSWKHNSFTNTYTYECSECGFLNRVNYPAHIATKKDHNIKDVIGFNALTNTLIVQDDYSVVMELRFDRNAMDQLISHLEHCVKVSYNDHILSELEKNNY